MLATCMCRVSPTRLHSTLMQRRSEQRAVHLRNPEPSEVEELSRGGRNKKRADLQVFQSGDANVWLSVHKALCFIACVRGECVCLAPTQDELVSGADASARALALSSAKHLLSVHSHFLNEAVWRKVNQANQREI